MRWVFLFLTLFSFPSFSKVKKYHLSIGPIPFSVGEKRSEYALAINKQIPAPTLRFKKGDTALIHVENKLSEETTLHWHGVLVPWNMDGPSFTNNFPIKPGETFTFKFPIRQTGTYWYHSHTNLQEQRGVFGAIVIEEENPLKVDHDKVLVLSDFTLEHPLDVLKKLRKVEHYYSYKKEFFPSLISAIKNGNFMSYLHGGLVNMGAMDPSDVGYDAFLINGKETQNMNFKKGDKIRFRLINAGSSTHFYVHIGDLRNFTIISKDGLKIKPLQGNELFIAPGETYDLIFKMPKMSLEFKATALDRTGSAQLILGKGPLEKAHNKKKPKPYDHKNHHRDKRVRAISYKDMESFRKTTYPKHLKRHHLKLKLTGKMKDYIWSINGKTFSEERYIKVKENEVIRFEMVNQTMMNHPMHIHGHFFRALNKKGGRSPLFHTVDVGPMKKQTIEFLTKEPGIWFFHCHNLYHMMGGMSRLVKYQNFKRPKALIEAEKEHMANRSFFKDVVSSNLMEVFTNHVRLRHESTKGVKDALEIDLEVHIDDEDLRGRLFYERTLVSTFLTDFKLITGVDQRKKERYLFAGLELTLPFSIETQLTLRYPFSFYSRFTTHIPLYKKIMAEWDAIFEYERGEFKSLISSSLLYQVSSSSFVGILYSHGNQKNHSSLGVGFTSHF